MNDLSGSLGRLCNNIIRAFVASYLAEKRNLPINYGEYSVKMDTLGLPLYKQGTVIYNETQIFNEKMVIDELIIPTLTPMNIDIRQPYCQSKELANYLYTLFKDDTKRNSVIEANIYSDRYMNNNDCFVHIRLDDTKQWNLGYEYYDSYISKVSYTKLYIASDEPTHEICQKLMEKYNGTIVMLDDIHTIMFGSTCAHVVLSGGSFSFMIGILSFFSNVYCYKKKVPWYPCELFHIDEWNTIET